MTGAVVALSVGLALGLTSCGGEGGAASGDCKPADKLTIAYQPGLGYASLLIARQEKTLEDALPDVEVTWQELNSGSAIRDGIIGGNLQVGAGGIGPFLVGLDAGVDWKVISGLNDMSLYLNAMDPDITSLEDLEGAGSIAMPAPDSIQSVILRKGAEEELGDAKALDSQIVSLGHPDGVQALIGGQLAAHLTSPPFQEQEIDEGAHKLLASYDLFGEHTFNSIFTETEFADCNPKVIDALVTAVADANAMLTDKPADAAKVLAAELDLPADEVEEQITSDDVSFVNTPKGFGAFAEFMRSIGMIKKVPETKDMFYDTEATADAS
ncbi:ABC transporter substrate-binding protein [Nocardioides sp. LHG3406-4]|uniref:ABC transporter substrate-binding protein n=1 Tax=Nocardioides sp. LHG3406-4 TaxID=2804575 RepID=UPI003CF35556